MPSGKTIFSAKAATAPAEEKMLATSSLSPEEASSEDALDASASNSQGVAASALGELQGECSPADAANDNALSPWLWAGIALVAACALAALGVYRAKIARKDAQAGAAQ